VKFWLLTLTLSQCGAEVSDVEDYFEEGRGGGGGEGGGGAASLSRSCHNKHRPAISSTQLHCCLCSSQGQKKGTLYTQLNKNPSA